MKSIIRILNRPDPYYFVVPIRRPHKSWAAAHVARGKTLAQLARLDHRPPQQREAAEFRAWYPWVVALRAEAQHVQHVAKAQATLRWRKSHPQSKGLK